MEFLCRFNMEKKLNNNEKNLLLQDLCARLPYGVKCQTEESTRGLKSSATVLKNYLANEIAFYYTFNQDKE